jgi:O-antigen ligase
MQLTLRMSGRTDPRVAAAAVATTFGAAALLVGIAAARDPLAVITAVAGMALVGAMTLKVEWAALAFVAVEPFEGYLESLSGTAIKFVGALLFLAWLVRLLTRATPAQIRHPVALAIGALFVSLLAATALHANGTSGAAVAARYLSFMAVTLVLLDCMRTSLPPRRVAAVYVASCTAAAAVGLAVYLMGSGGRASGPITDPNDFAFFLITAVPLALYLWRGAHRGRQLFLAAAGLLLLTTLATVSRGALLGLAAMVGYALCTRQLRLRAVLATVGVLLAGVLAVAGSAPSVVQRSLSNKQHVAAQNVQDRFVTWSMAAEMTADHPLLGTGPGGFGANYSRYLRGRVTDPSQLDVAHEMYLQTSAELGLVGLVAFGSALGLGFAGARRGARDASDPADLGSAVCTALVGVLVAAAFLTEQYYLPVWLLVALGAALDPVR